MIHVRDASRAVTVMNDLTIQGESSASTRRYAPAVCRRARRPSFQKPEPAASVFGRFEGTARDFRLGLDGPLRAPTFTGNRAFYNYPLDDLLGRIDWTPFFLTWELRGTYPSILEHPKYGREARTLFEDAKRLLDKVIDQRALKARAVIGFYPANSIGDDVELYTDNSRSNVLEELHFLRQQSDKRGQRASLPKENFCLADFVAPKESGCRGLRWRVCGDDQGWARMSTLRHWKRHTMTTAR